MLARSHARGHTSRPSTLKHEMACTKAGCSVHPSILGVDDELIVRTFASHTPLSDVDLPRIAAGESNSLLVPRTLKMSSRSTARKRLSTKSSPQFFVSSRSSSNSSSSSSSNDDDDNNDNGNGGDVHTSSREDQNNHRRLNLQRELSNSWKPQKARLTTPRKSSSRRLTVGEADRTPSYVQVQKKTLSSVPVERGTFHRETRGKASQTRSFSLGRSPPSDEDGRNNVKALLSRASSGGNEHKQHKHRRAAQEKEKQTTVPIQEHVACSNYLSSRAQEILRKKGLSGKGDRHPGGIPSVIFFSDSSLNGTLDTACSTIETAESSIDIGANTMEEYNLMPVPSKWLEEAPHLRKICKSNQIWEAYQKFRSSVEYNAKHRASKRAISQLVEETYMFPFAKSSGGLQWPNNSYTEIKTVAFNRQDEIKFLDVSAVVFSPVAVPRAAEFCHHYEVKSGECIIAIAKWKYRTIYISPTTADGIKKGPWMTICSTKQVHGGIKDADVSGLSPEAIAAMRNWLIGTANCNSARSVLDDFDFLRFVFASTLTPLKPTDSSSRICMHSLTRSSVTETETNKRRHMDELRDSFAKTRPISWLEFEVRKATGRLRPRDQVKAEAIGRKSPVKPRTTDAKAT